MFSITSFTETTGRNVTAGDKVMTLEQLLTYVSSNGTNCEVIEIHAVTNESYKDHVGFLASIHNGECYSMALGKDEKVWLV